MEKPNEPIPKPNHFDAKSYNLNGKIMLSAVVLLFFIIILMLCLHVYARWYLYQSRLRRRNRLRRRTQLLFSTDNTTTTNSVISSRGLDASVIASLPEFIYDQKTKPENTAECAVCLSEFEPGIPGRVLPKCNHSFHTQCIDMWFYSHDTCPLCRAPVEPTIEVETRPEVVITVCEPETDTGSSSNSGLEGEKENRTGEEVCSTSVGLRTKPSFKGITVEVPAMNELVRNESGCDSSSSTQLTFRSSLKRILSMEWKGSTSPSSCGGVDGCSSLNGLKVEQGGRVETQ